MKKTLIDLYLIQYSINQFKIKKWKDIPIVTNKKIRNQFCIKDLLFADSDKRSRVKLDKSVFTGQTCLDESKILSCAF